MPSKPVFTEIEGQRLKLTNLDKVLYPSVGVLKAEVINYFISHQALFLKHLRHRPLTLIRWPDGVEGKRFYSKNKPTWTPTWVASQQLPDSSDDNDYVLANNAATLGWLGNLAALELHPMGSTVQQLDKPDHFIFDLDPLSDNEFPQLKEVAFLLADYLRAHDYTPYIKTSGSRGLHIYVPILPKWTFKELTHSLKTLSKSFIKEKAPYCTLAVHKQNRKGKILLDIYRNYQGNTCVAPYSLRGKAGAPISTPIPLSELEALTSSRQYNLRNIDDYLKNENPWADFFEQAASLHDHANRSTISPTVKEGDSLKAYDKKRDFSKTAEPKAEVAAVAQQRFVIQLHDASNLHYDLRLESEGVLWSWAIPKALPTKMDKARLAIRTEDHPVKYLTFEGVIPKEEYGGGEMWVMETGTFEWIEKKENKLKFKLNGNKFSASYNLFKTKNNQWLCKAIELPNMALYANPPEPMLANARKKIPTLAKYHYEIKWDGIRVSIHVSEEAIQIFSRSGRELSKQFPELTGARKEFEIEEGIFDAEIVVLDAEGKPIFPSVISRMHTLGERSIAQASRNKPATCYVFDCLIVDGHQQVHRPQERRHACLRAIIPKKRHFRVSEAFTDGEALFKGIEAAGMEGIMAKDKTAPYHGGQRSEAWLKIKVRNDIQATVIGYTAGEGDRSGMIGALHLAVIAADDRYEYLGKVGTGFDHDTLKAIMEKISSLPEVKKPIKEAIEEPQRTTWIEGKYRCNIEFASRTPTGTLREPVWKGWTE